MPRRTRGELNTLARAAYESGDPAKLAELGALTPAEKCYLATRPEFQNYTIALMFDAVIGNERVTKSQRASAAWFHRVINEHADKEKGKKRGRIPQDAQVIDASGGGDE